MSKLKNRAEALVDLKSCKHCGYLLKESDCRKLPRKSLPEKQGHWGGVEKMFLEIFKVSCPNQDCKKTYTVKSRASEWFYR